MSPTWIDVPGSQLGSLTDSVDFTVTGAGGGGSGAGGGSGVSLQPILNDPIGAWALADATGIVFADRSGFGRTASTWGASHNPVAGPDSRMSGSYALGAGMLYLPYSAVLLLGAMTITMRVCMTSTLAASTLVQCALQGEYEAANIAYELSVSAPSLTPYYRCETGAGADVVAMGDPSLNLTLGAWHFLALRRAADGAVTLNVDNRPAYTVSRTPPTGGDPTLYIGGGIADLQYNDTGVRLMKDVMLWDKRLTDAQLEAQRVGMGTLS